MNSRMFNIFLFIIISAPIAISSESAFQALGWLERLPVLRVFLNLLFGVVAGYVTVFGANQFGDYSPSRRNFELDSLFEQLLGCAPIIAVIVLTGIGFLICFSVSTDIAVFQEENIAPEVGVLFAITAMLLVMFYWGWIAALDIEMNTKAIVISIPSLGAALGIGLVVAKSYSTSFLSHALILTFSTLIIWSLIAGGSVIIVSVQSMLFSFNDQREMSFLIQLVLYFIAVLLMVYLSVFDGWRFLASL